MPAFVRSSGDSSGRNGAERTIASVLAMRGARKMAYTLRPACVYNRVYGRLSRWRTRYGRRASTTGSMVVYQDGVHVTACVRLQQRLWSSIKMAYTLRPACVYNRVCGRLSRWRTRYGRRASTTGSMVVYQDGVHVTDGVRLQQGLWSSIKMAYTLRPACVYNRVYGRLSSQ